MPSYEVGNLVTVTKTDMIDDELCPNRNLRSTVLRIWHQASHRAALEVPHRPAQRSLPLLNLTIPIVKSHSVLNTHPYLLVLSGAPENALPESESTLQCSRGGWEHLEVLRSTGEGCWSVWEACVWHLDGFPFRGCKFIWVRCGSKVEIRQQNVNLSGSHRQASQTLWSTAPVILCTSRCSQASLKLCEVLSESTRAFSGAPESTCRNGGQFRMLLQG